MKTLTDPFNSLDCGLVFEMVTGVDNYFPKTSAKLLDMQHQYQFLIEFLFFLFIYYF